MATKSDIVFRYCSTAILFNILRNRIYFRIKCTCITILCHGFIIFCSAKTKVHLLSYSQYNQSEFLPQNGVQTCFNGLNKLSRVFKLCEMYLMLCNCNILNQVMNLRSNLFLTKNRIKLCAKWSYNYSNFYIHSTK